MADVIALTRQVSASIGECALTFREREIIDLERAREQHRAYEQLLRQLGARVNSLPPEDDLPDAVFVEDTALVLPEIAVMMRPRLPSRQAEVPSVAHALAAYREQAWLSRGSMDGGDIVVIDRDVYVGLSGRTDQAGIDDLGATIAPFGYRVHSVAVDGCLHLKSACAYLGRATVLVNPQRINPRAIRAERCIDIPPDETSANALRIGEVVVLPTSAPGTAERVRKAGFKVEVIDVSELQKAEAGLTCCSILIAPPNGMRSQATVH